MSLKVDGAINNLTSNLSKNTKITNDKTDTTNSAKTGNTTHRSSQEYLSNLKQKFSNMNIVVADFKNKNQERNYMKGCSGGNNIAISSKVLERMAKNPEVAEKYEKIIENVPNVINEVKGKIESDPNCKLLAAGAIIEEDGNVSYWTYTCSTTTTEVGTGKERMQKQLEKNREIKREKAEKSKTDTIQSGKDKVQDYYEELCKKFPQINFNKEGSIFKFTVTGTDIKAITQQIISKIPAISSGTSDRTSVDVLV